MLKIYRRILSVFGIGVCVALGVAYTLDFKVPSFQHQKGRGEEQVTKTSRTSVVEKNQKKDSEQAMRKSASKGTKQGRNQGAFLKKIVQRISPKGKKSSEEAKLISAKSLLKKNQSDALTVEGKAEVAQSTLKKEIIDKVYRLAKNSESPVESLINLALHFQAIKQNENALELLEEAQAYIAYNADRKEVDAELYALSRAYLGLNQKEKAEELIWSIESPAVRNRVFGQLALVYSRQGNTPAAERTISHISNENQHDRTLANHVFLNILKGANLEDLETVQRISQGNQKDRVYHNLALSFARAGKFVLANQAYQGITDQALSNRTWNVVLSEIAKRPVKESEEGLVTLAKGLIVRDEDLQQLVDDKVGQQSLERKLDQKKGRITRHDIDAGYQTLAILYGRRGDFRNAMLFAQKVNSRANFDRTLSAISALQIEKLGSPAARRTTQRIKNPHIKNEALYSLFRKDLQRGKLKESSHTLSELSQNDKKALAYSETSQLLAKRGNHVDSKLYISKATNLAEGLNNPLKSARVLSNVANVYFTLGEDSEAMETAEGIGHRGVKDSTLRSLAVKYAQKNEVQYSLEALGAIQTDTIKDSTESTVAQILAGHSRGANAIKDSRKFETREQQIHFLLSVARKI